jgi:hypothetical protein
MRETMANAADQDNRKAAAAADGIARRPATGAGRHSAPAGPPEFRPRTGCQRPPPVRGGRFHQGARGGGRGFEMELQAEGRARLKGLVFARGAAGQMHGAGREVEGFAVPVENFGGGRKTEGARSGVRNSGDGKPADFLDGIGADPRTQGVGEKLCAEAHTQQRFAGGEIAREPALFIRKPWMPGLVMHAHGAAQHDQEIHGGGIRQLGGFVEARGGEIDARAAEPGRKCARAFEGDMLEDMRPQGSGSGVGVCVSCRLNLASGGWVFHVVATFHKRRTPPNISFYAHMRIWMND